MEPLKTNKLLLTWIGMCAADKFTNKTNKIAYTGVASMVFALTLFSVLSNTTFLLKFLSIDLKRALFAFMTVSGFLAMLYTQINAFNLRFKINELFEKLTKICCESK